jgi:hypothetical protein
MAWRVAVPSAQAPATQLQSAFPAIQPLAFGGRSHLAAGLLGVGMRRRNAA